MRATQFEYTLKFVFLKGCHLIGGHRWDMPWHGSQNIQVFVRHFQWWYQCIVYSFHHVGFSSLLPMISPTSWPISIIQQMKIEQKNLNDFVALSNCIRMQNSKWWNNGVLSQLKFIHSIFVGVSLILKEFINICCLCFSYGILCAFAAYF